MVLFFISDVIVASIVAAAIGAGIAFLFLYKKGGAVRAENGKELNDPIAKGIRDNAPLFGQLYEAMYLVSKGKSAKVRSSFAAWNTRVDALDDDSEFVVAFRDEFSSFADWKEHKAEKKAKRLIKAVKKAGIVRDDAESVFAEDDFTDKYIITGGSVEEGEELDVLAPYWTANDEVLEKGIAR